MSLSRTGSFDPFKRAMNDMFDEMERDFAQPPFGPLARRFPSPLFSAPLFPTIPAITGAAGSNFGVSLDFHETPRGFELSADLPGMRKEDISVDVDHDSNMLTVSGERKQEKEETNDNADGQRTYHFVERSYGRMSRSVRLPETADVSRADASYNDGVLKLHFPKRDALPSSRMKIPIMGGSGVGGGGGAQGGGGGKVAIGEKAGEAEAGEMAEG